MKLTPHAIYSDKDGKLKCTAPCCNKENKMRLVCKTDKEYSTESLEELVKDLPMRLVVELINICIKEIEEQNQIKVSIRYTDINYTDIG